MYTGAEVLGLDLADHVGSHVDTYLSGQTLDTLLFAFFSVSA